MIQRIFHGDDVRSVFGDWEETIIWSCLDGTMGELYGREKRSVMAALGDFIFLAGEPDRELVLFRPEGSKKEFVIMVPQNEQWAALIEDVYGEKARKIQRYATKKEPEAFDRKRLQRLAARLEDGYLLKNIDKSLYEACRLSDWSKDLVSQFADYEAFSKTGLGIVALKDGKIVSGASSYSRYKMGIEIEIDTDPLFRRKGLATACGASLILECLDRGLYPSWDAHNLWSIALAEKLGYHRSEPYIAYEIFSTFSFTFR
ncbi:GNAT family N-acetyltransferase [Lacrimispora sp. 210928-DFI.3.58]|uniref:GNAT family N-acetyltransferase n=1 Tax=Lacrimispora sp. 210928-DFI.3.58 TaxID=2883214 RepID=UPI0015B491A3|nr:GNAT family N-acetyltransferase [Lacrimispora sp. 210928-DFI.3.58]MCB7320406.1 GNAT family N-acetyltransferase [Lacrimispora sp. 210928-DFI.3.58]